VTITVLALLAALCLPSLSRASGEARATRCQNNLKQLQFGWWLYAEENENCLPPNRARRQQFEMVNLKGSWVMGNTKLDQRDANIRAGVLYAELNSIEVYRCPSDKSTVEGHPSLARTRSYSISLWLNAELDSGTAADQINDVDLNLCKLSQVEANDPSRIWVFIEEHEQTIDDGVFVIGSNTYAPEAPAFWVSVPADASERRESRLRGRPCLSSTLAGKPLHLVL